MAKGKFLLNLIKYRLLPISLYCYLQYHMKNCTFMYAILAVYPRGETVKRTDYTFV